LDAYVVHCDAESYSAAPNATSESMDAPDSEVSVWHVYPLIALRSIYVGQTRREVDGKGSIETTHKGI
jgi:hypothetical protein